ncbi:hypothetical protein FML29_11350 [Klebsiella oxytoca]|uniref:Uncharacterized protein n=1 Tax=Klebsiella oxytoca TaxID=571 RepID=A0AAD3YN05_KLEOX|nr:hypothetical protein HMPREF9692_02229 [Klebsiella oxytoca 10-5248]MBZ7683308.1 hypothetical protein [Klebsiella oxytoca]OFV50369.1 hypothetical protein HMPREF3178_12130 [Klebsiella sp. HMSC09D12]TXV00512.1 hypothetical protein D4M90_02860 [Klebsiella oxytoca]HAU4355530.1 hypothetical protein [Klebsiella oxytoca]
MKAMLRYFLKDIYDGICTHVILICAIVLTGLIYRAFDFDVWFTPAVVIVILVAHWVLSQFRI